jgi:hypothetical protein
MLKDIPFLLVIFKNLSIALPIIRVYQIIIIFVYGKNN